MTTTLDTPIVSTSTDATTATALLAPTCEDIVDLARNARHKRTRSHRHTHRGWMTRTVRFEVRFAIAAAYEAGELSLADIVAVLHDMGYRDATREKVRGWIRTTGLVKGSARDEYLRANNLIDPVFDPFATTLGPDPDFDYPWAYDPDTDDSIWAIYDQILDYATRSGRLMLADLLVALDRHGFEDYTEADAEKWLLSTGHTRAAILRRGLRR